MASGRGPGRFRRGRRALQGRDPAHAPLRAGFPVLEHRPGPAHARRERGVHVPGAAEPVRMAQGHARANRVRQRRGRGRRASGNGIRWARLFQAFQAHYGFDCPPLCYPYAGHEKGAVEAKVGMVRRKLFVPKPSVWNLGNFNSRLPGRCLELGRKPTTPRTRRRPVCSARIAGRCCPCPPNAST